MSHPYEELFAYQRPEKKHPAMDLQDRAKIFSPFAALTGHGDAILQMQEKREDRKILSETEQDELNRKLQQVEKGDSVTVTYFLYDPGSDGTGHVAEGRYVTVSGNVKKIDVTGDILIFEDGQEIEIGDIIAIDKSESVKNHER